MNTRLSRHTGIVLLAGSVLTAALLYLGVLNNGFVADTWVFVTPRTLGETLGYFFRSIIPDEWEALWAQTYSHALFLDRRQIMAEHGLWAPSGESPCPYSKYDANLADKPVRAERQEYQSWSNLPGFYRNSGVTVFIPLRLVR